MKIQSIEVWKQDLGLSEPYSIAYKTTDSVENVFVALHLGNGHFGLGSCNPSQMVVGESLEMSYAKLKEDEGRWLKGLDIREIYHNCELVFNKYPDFPGVRCALDVALWDGFTKFLNTPLCSFLGKKTGPLPTSVTIGIMNVDETLKKAKKFIEQGFKVLKIKLGGAFDEDIERLAKLREKFGSQILIRVDPNQAYSAEIYKGFFEKCRPFDLELIEQPLPQKAVEEMRKLPPEFKAKLAADESLINVKDAIALILPERCCNIFNVKLMKTGGISTARMITHVADYFSVELMWGCNDESKVSIAAALHLAYASAKTRYIDLDGSFDLTTDAVEGGFKVKDGLMYLTEAPGLGVVRV